MFTRLLAWCLRGEDTMIAWSDRRRDQLERLHLERLGVHGFHFEWSKQFRPDAPREAA